MAPDTSRRHANRVDVQRRPDVEPHWLPEPAVLDVPVLLAARQLVVVELRKPRVAAPACRRGVDDADDQLVGAGLDPARDVEREGRVRPFMAARGLPIHEDVGLIVDGTKAQQHALRDLRGRDREPCAVPRDADVVAQVGELCVPREADLGRAPTRGRQRRDLECRARIGDQLPARVQADRVRRHVCGRRKQDGESNRRTGNEGSDVGHGVVSMELGSAGTKVPAYVLSVPTYCQSLRTVRAYVLSAYVLSLSYVGPNFSSGAPVICYRRVCLPTMRIVIGTELWSDAVPPLVSTRAVTYSVCSAGSARSSATISKVRLV